MLVYFIYFGAFLSIIFLSLYAFKNAKFTARNMSIAALFAALTAVGAYIKVPIPYVPFTLQTFFCIFSAIILGAELGMVSQLLYIIIGLSGIPVFAQGGGPTYVLQPTFGYLLGFIVGAYVTGKMIKKFGYKKFISVFLSSLAGLLTIYALGVPYLFFIKNVYLKTTSFTFNMALFYGFFTTITGDIISMIIVSIVALKVLHLSLRKSGI